tara:strand:+ start:601 stop:1455 length:855 start_codon:yes stop_codon:yes gene_type:complete
LLLIIENQPALITSKNNPLIKRFRSFKDKLPVKESEFFCIEGTHLLEESINAGLIPFKVIATSEWIAKNNSTKAILDLSLITVVSKNALASAISTKNPDGVAALVHKSSLMDFSLSNKDDLILVLDRIQDPGNMGNLFRIALAAGVNKVLLAGGANPLNPKVLRSSCGSIFHLPYKRIEGDEENIIKKLLISLKDLNKKGFQVILTAGASKSAEIALKPYWDLNWQKPTALILGNEGSGIHNEIKEVFNEIITIPHSELVESLNVACVAVPLLLERTRAALNSK